MRITKEELTEVAKAMADDNGWAYNAAKKLIEQFVIQGDIEQNYQYNAQEMEEWITDALGMIARDPV